MSADDALLAAAQTLPAELFAVIDGGKFDDLDLSLRASGLGGMPLYLEGASARESAGYLVPLAHPGALEAAIDLAAPKSALVIWSWPLGQMALYRHLRTLNLVEIPNEAREEAEAEGETETAAEMPAYETVLFRHWDPNVLGALLPLMEEPQRARFLGAATGLAFDTPEHGGVKSALRPPALPPAPHGMLRFSKEQMAGIEGAREEASVRKIEQYLRRVAPNETVSFDDETLRHLVLTSQTAGKNFGLTTELSFGLWSWLWLRTKGAVGTAEPIRRALTIESGNADEALITIFDGILGRSWRT